MWITSSLWSKNSDIFSKFFPSSFLLKTSTFPVLYPIISTLSFLNAQLIYSFGFEKILLILELFIMEIFDLFDLILEFIILYK
jgi:hypothetical protein